MSVRFTNSQVKKVISNTKQDIIIQDKTSYVDSFKFWIAYSRILSKPRLTQSDKWNHRQIVERWYAYKDHVIMEYKRQKGVLYNQPISIDFLFKLKPDFKRRDLSNMIKGVEDSLNEVAWTDDCVRIIRAYGIAQVFFNRNIEDDEACRVIINPIISKKISSAYRDGNNSGSDDITEEEIERYRIDNEEDRRFNK